MKLQSYLLSTLNFSFSRKSLIQHLSHVQNHSLHQINYVSSSTREILLILSFTSLQKCLCIKATVHLPQDSPSTSVAISDVSYTSTILKANPAISPRDEAFKNTFDYEAAFLHPPAPPCLWESLRRLCEEFDPAEDSTVAGATK